MNGVPSHTGPILDYASPRPRGKVRLPSQSRLEVREDRDGVIATEWLEAKAGAVGAMGVGLLTLAFLPWAVVAAIRQADHQAAELEGLAAKLRHAVGLVQ